MSTRTTSLHSSAAVLLLVAIGLACAATPVRVAARWAAGGLAPAATNSIMQVYGDDLAPCWVDWSWGRGPAFSLYSQGQVNVGSYAIAADLDEWGGLSFHRTDLRTGPYDALEFYIHGGQAGGQRLLVFLYGSGGQSGSELPAVSLNTPYYIAGGSVDAGVWKAVRIPLADLGGTNTVIGRLSIQAEGAQPLFYVDDLRLTGSAAPPPPEALALHVDVTDVKGPISSRTLGTNALWWNENLHQNTDVIAKLRAAGVRTVRFPGGSAADSYHWQVYEPGDSSNAWSTNTTDFMQFVQAVGAEPVITVNFGTGSAQEAADWVRFTNATHDWGVQYWEVGNEIYGDWEQSWTHDPTAYVQGDATHDGFLAFCQAMKAVDPTIRVGAVGAPYPGQYNNWGSTVLDLAGECVDFYTFPYYPLNPGARSYERLLGDPIVTWPDMAVEVAAMLAAYAPPGRQIDVAVSEYNSYTSAPEDLAIQTVNMLFLADTLGQILEQGYPLAQQWNILQGTSENGGDYGLLLQSPSFYRQPSYYALAQWQHVGDERLGRSVNRDACTEMTAYASRSTGSGAVTILAVNKTGTAQSGAITLDGMTVAPASLIARVAQGAGLDAQAVTYNGVSNPPIDLEQAAPVLTHGLASTFAYSFPPFSVTSLRVVVPPTAAAIGTAMSAGTALLSWAHYATNERYEVHRSASPYFAPSTATLLEPLAGPFASQVSYLDAAGSSSSTRYYYVLSLNEADDSARSNQVAAFDFALAPGNPAR